LHAKNLAIMAGAEGSEIEKVAKKMAEENDISASSAKKTLEEIRRT
jgi:hydroxymethylglutaryl-CoA reductase